jgi:hypothetical protein
MELTLREFPQLVSEVEFIYNKIMTDEFEILCDSGCASPSSPAEYRGALKSLLGSGALTPIPTEALADGYVFATGAMHAAMAIHVQFYVNEAPSDIFGVFLARNDGSRHELTVSLYDILAP